MDYPVRRIIMRSVDLSMLRHVSKGLTEFSLPSEIDVIAYKPYMYMYVV